jgi:hypothetical protein
MEQAPRDFESRASTSFTTPAFGATPFLSQPKECVKVKGTAFSYQPSAISLGILRGDLEWISDLGLGSAVREAGVVRRA